MTTADRDVAQDPAEESLWESLPAGSRVAVFAAVVSLLAALAWMVGDAVGPDVLGPPEIPVLRPITAPGEVPVEGPGGYYPSDLAPGEEAPIVIPEHAGGGGHG